MNNGTNAEGYEFRGPVAKLEAKQVLDEYDTSEVQRIKLTVIETGDTNE